MARFRRRRPRGSRQDNSFEATVGGPDGRRYDSSAYRRLKRQQGATSFGAGGVIVNIDTREIEKLRQALVDTGQGVKREDRIVVAALNEGMDRLNTKLKRSLRKWTGIKRARWVNERLKKHPASKGRWEAAVRVESPYTKIDSMFGARMLTRFKAVSHSAWNVRKRAKGAFMLPGQDVAIKRVGKGRWDLKSLYGPNLAREMDRHTPQVRAMTVHAAERYVLPALTRLVHVQLRKAKAKHGL